MSVSCEVDQSACTRTRSASWVSLSDTRLSRRGNGVWASCSECVCNFSSIVERKGPPRPDHEWCLWKTEKGGDLGGGEHGAVRDNMRRRLCVQNRRLHPSAIAGDQHATAWGTFAAEHQSRRRDWVSTSVSNRRLHRFVCSESRWCDEHPEITPDCPRVHTLLQRQREEGARCVTVF